MTGKTLSLALACCASLLTGACQTSGATRPATLETADEATLKPSGARRSGLAQATSPKHRR